MSYHLMHAHAPPPGFHLRVTLSPHNHDPRKWLRAKRGYTTFGRSGHRAPQISFQVIRLLMRTVGTSVAMGRGRVRPPHWDRVHGRS
jgi:hypothetical protein